MGATAKEMAERAPTVVTSLTFCSSTKETLETADSRGEIIENEGLNFFSKEPRGVLYLILLQLYEPEIYGERIVPVPQLLSLPGEEDARSRVETERKSEKGLRSTVWTVDPPHRC